MKENEPNEYREQSVKIKSEFSEHTRPRSKTPGIYRRFTKTVNNIIAVPN